MLFNMYSYYYTTIMLLNIYFIVIVFKIYSIYKCNERPPTLNTRHTTIGNVINMSN